MLSTYIVAFDLQRCFRLFQMPRLSTGKKCASSWPKEYIDFNTKCRADSKSTFAKDFFRPMNNSCFGKTQEILRNRVNVEVKTNRENLVIMQTTIANLKLCKPDHLGFSVLELFEIINVFLSLRYNAQKLLKHPSLLHRHR